MDRVGKLKEFLQASPDDSFLQHALALEYIKADKDEDARQLFENILQNDPGYIGSYYHLGKLLERNNETGEALKIYEAGMAAAKQAADQHAYNELQAAFDNLNE